MVNFIGWKGGSLSINCFLLSSHPILYSIHKSQDFLIPSAPAAPAVANQPYATFSGSLKGGADELVARGNEEILTFLNVFVALVVGTLVGGDLVVIFVNVNDTVKL